MRSFKFYFKYLLAFLAVSIPGLTMAQNAYQVGATLPFTPQALNDNGQVLGSSTTSTMKYYSGYGYAGSRTVDYYLTGSDGANPTAVGTVTSSVSPSGSSVSSASGTLAVEVSNSSPIPVGDFSWTGPSGFSQTEPTNPNPSTCLTGCAITGPSMSFVGLNNNGIAAGNADFTGSDVPLEGTWGSIVNFNTHDMTLFHGTLTGLSSSGGVAFNNTQTVSSASFFNLGTNTVNTVQDLGFGSVSGYSTNAGVPGARRIIRMEISTEIIKLRVGYIQVQLNPLQEHLSQALMG